MYDFYGKKFCKIEQMNIKIDKKIINTTKCDKSFKCLTNHENLCKVSYHINGKINFLESNNKKCKFKIYFADKFICSCPVRNELYVRYKI